jgi:hypothetical protein
MFEYLSKLNSARKYFEEGEALIDRDPVQAGEKLYRAYEEAIKALAIYHGLREVLARVEEGVDGLLLSLRRLSRS